MFGYTFPEKLILFDEQFKADFCVVNLVYLEVLARNEDKVPNRPMMLFRQILENSLELLYELVAFFDEIELL